MRATERRRKTRFIHIFNGTPEGIVCPHFWICNFANGCDFKCTYCYLQKTLFKTKMKLVLYTNTDDLYKQVRDFIAKYEGCTLSIGASTDPLIWLEYKDCDIIQNLIKLFDGTNNYLLTCTKTDKTDKLLDIEPSDNTIISFSINDKFVNETYEYKAPSSIKRLQSAKKLIEHGWKVRIRLDPMIPHTRNGSYWKTDYSDIIKYFDPRTERITLGSLRYYPPMKNKLAGLCETKLDDTCTDRKMRIPVHKRILMYNHAIDELKAIGINYNKVGLCKETDQLWEYYPQLKKDRCNCTP